MNPIVITKPPEIVVKTDQAHYIETLLNLYLGLPETPSQASQSDLRLAYSLYQRNMALEIIEAAFLLASVRRLFRDPALPPLPAIRSLYYFLPVINEITANPLPQDYIHYLRYKLDSYAVR